MVLHGHDRFGVLGHYSAIMAKGGASLIAAISGLIERAVASMAQNHFFK